MFTPFLPHCQSVAVQTRRKVRRFRHTVTKRLTRTFWGARALRVYLTFGLLFMLFFARIHDPLLVELPFASYAVISSAQAEAGLEVNVGAGVLSTDIQFPVEGRLTTPFKGGHPGIDLATSTGVDIYPYGEGRVVETRFELFGLGRSVVVDHGDGLVSVYGHMSTIFVKPGDAVTLTTVVGEVGSTGHSSGPHLHLEIYDQGRVVDPLRYLPKTWI